MVFSFSLDCFSHKLVIWPQSAEWTGQTQLADATGCFRTAHPDCRPGCSGRTAAADRTTPRRWGRRWWTADVSIWTCNQGKFPPESKWHFGAAVKARCQDKQFLHVLCIFPYNYFQKGDNPKLWLKTCHITAVGKPTCSTVAMGTKGGLSASDVSRKYVTALI